MKTFLKVLAIIGGYYLIMFVAGMLLGICASADMTELTRGLSVIVSIGAYGWFVVIPLVIWTVIKGIKNYVSGQA